MKAIQIREYGGADALRYEDVAKPRLQDGDVMVRVAAASFNPIDAKIRQGFMKDEMPRPLPFVLGWDCAGTVEAVGANATRFRVGDVVYSYPEFRRGGTYAEFVAINESQVAHKPATLSFVESAALPMTAQAAWTAINIAGLQGGQTILIHGGAGGVGTMAIQLGKASNAKVITTAAGDGLELAKSLGADEVIDYRTTNFKEVVRDVDVVLDVLGGQTQEDSWDVLKRGGVLVATATPPARERAEQHGVRAEFIFTPPSGEALEKIAALVDEGKLRPVIGAELPLAGVRQAHEARGGNGKTVIRVEEY